MLLPFEVTKRAVFFLKTNKYIKGWGHFMNRHVDSAQEPVCIVCLLCTPYNERLKYVVHSTSWTHGIFETI